MSEFEEVKEIGEVNCSKCKCLIKISKRTTYDKPDPRRKISEELLAEKSIQKTLEE